MQTREWAANNLAAKLLAEPWTLPAIAAGISAVLGRVNPRTRAALCVRVFALGEEFFPPAPKALADYLICSEFFRPPRDRRVAAVLAPPRFAPMQRFADLAIPAFATTTDLANWLGLEIEKLEWLADERRTHGRTTAPKLQNYFYAFVQKQDGSKRLLEAPKPRLKAIQRRMLHEILDKIPVHPRAHGFVAGRSCLTNAQIHASEEMVVTFDLAQFFPSICLPRIHGLFRALGYPWAVARHLAGLCTTITPTSVSRSLPAPAQPLHGVPHLPQGAPTSPALANLLAFTLDQRLVGLARAAGAHYTRYADDLAFSGDKDFSAKLNTFSRSVRKIVEEEGFLLNASKTRIMPQSTRQRITGIVVNTHCNIGRAEFDSLKAILYNCVRYSARDQNRAGVADFRGHLLGRIVWVEQINPQRGAKLRELFEKIKW